MLLTKKNIAKIAFMVILYFLLGSSQAVVAEGAGVALVVIHIAVTDVFGNIGICGIEANLMVGINGLQGEHILPRLFRGGGDDREGEEQGENQNQ